MVSAVTYPITIGVRVTTEQAKRLRDLAEADDRRPSALARRLLIESLDRYTPKERTTVS
jgi:predicted transcriptional regulator